MSPRLVGVLRTERLTDHMVRVVFGGDLGDFAVGAFTDHYVKIQFPPPGAPYEAPFDAKAIKERLPAEQWPRTRTYTVRHFDHGQRELTIDFVVHGDTGVAGPWAIAAQPGDKLQLQGPGGAYAPRADADWHLLIGDDTVVPAIGATLERLPDRAVAHVIMAADEQPLSVPAGTTIHWVDDVRTAVEALDFPEGTPHVFLHGEAGDVREVRRHLLAERGITRDGQSISGYWKRHRTEDGWREDKAEWNRLIEQDDNTNQPSGGVIA
jgi:NADPH-dependent ferric siderophore reductase